jgi:tetratricopeptide (TPR) repeat protein
MTASRSEEGRRRAEALRPIRRVHAPEAEGKRLRDVDAFERVTRFRLFAWSLVGAFMGLLLGVFLATARSGGALTVAVTTLAGWAMAYIGPRAILHWSGSAASTLYAPSGRSTPPKREYSLAESYAARGEYEMAIEAFESAVSENHTDSTPYLKIARIKRDKLSDFVGAGHWFKRALADSVMPSGLALLTMKELVELYDRRMGEPERATPLLARVAEEQADRPAGRWATEELARIKRGMSGEGAPDSVRASDAPDESGGPSESDPV